MLQIRNVIYVKNYFFAFKVLPGAFLSHLARKADLQNPSEKCVLFAHGPPLWLPLVFWYFKAAQFSLSFIFCLYIFLDFSSHSRFILSFFWNYAPRCGRKHNSKDRHTAAWTLKIAVSAPSHALLKASWHVFGDFAPSLAAKLHCKKRRKYVYYFYKSLLWDLLWEP